MTAQKVRPLDEEDAPAAPLLGNVNLSDPQLRALRVAVIVMGVLIVMGLMAVIGRIIYLMATPSRQISSASGALSPAVTATLPAGALIKSVTLQGDRLAIHYETATGSGIAVIDLASGRTLSRIQLVPDAPSP